MPFRVRRGVSGALECSSLVCATGAAFSASDRVVARGDQQKQTTPSGLRFSTAEFCKYNPTLAEQTASLPEVHGALRGSEASQTPGGAEPSRSKNSVLVCCQNCFKLACFRAF